MSLTTLLDNDGQTLNDATDITDIIAAQLEPCDPQETFAYRSLNLLSILSAKDVG